MAGMRQFPILSKSCRLPMNRSAMTLRLWMVMTAMTLFAAPSLAQQAVWEDGCHLPEWQPGYMDLHCIATGQGESNFYVLPDGTTMLVDAGDICGKWSNNHWPDTTRSAGEWVANYVRHFSPTHSPRVDYFLLSHFHSDHMGSAKNKDSGILATAKTLSFGKIVDRRYPTYDFPSAQKLLSQIVTFPYAAWVRGCVESGVSVAERFDIGSRSQFVLLHPECGSFDVEIYNIAASGERHSGKGKKTVKMWETGVDPSQFNENMMSCVYTLRYGKFKYYNGADLTGATVGSKITYDCDFESKIAPLVGHVDVMMMDHHGWKDSTNPYFLKTLAPDVIIVPCLEKSHPATATFDRVTNPQYPGRRELYITGDVSREQLGEERWSQFKPFGHVVIRVYEGGTQYRVYVLNPLSYDFSVKYMSDIYEVK